MRRAIPLGEFILKAPGSVVPAQFPTDQFDLFSIPAYESGTPDVVCGAEIGSAKNRVQPGDVLLSRIVPHIRRCWVVPETGPRLQIASGEWIVFRAKGMCGRYLRHYLLSDPFHHEYMRTVSGVGGSLLRARPSQVATIAIPVPSIEEQERIAAILDRAHAIRRKREQAVALIDGLLDSIFQGVSGDPAGRTRWPTCQLGDVCVRVTDGTHQSPKWESGGIPFLFVSNIVNGEINFKTKRFISERTWADLTARCPIERGDILYTTVGSYGNAALVEADVKFAFQRHIAHIKPDRRRIEPRFLVAMLQSPGVRHQADLQARGVAQKTINLRELKEFVVLVPPMAEQQRFVGVRDRILKLTGMLRASCAESESLCGSLSQRAFRGDL